MGLKQCEDFNGKFPKPVTTILLWYFEQQEDNKICNIFELINNINIIEINKVKCN